MSDCSGTFFSRQKRHAAVARPLCRGICARDGCESYMNPRLCLSNFGEEKVEAEGCALLDADSHRPVSPLFGGPLPSRAII